MNLSFADTYDVRYPDAWERRLIDVACCNAMLLMRKDKVDAAWSWVAPILDAWHDRGEAPKPYTAGTWGPPATIALIERDNRNWHEDAD